MLRFGKKLNRRNDRFLISQLRKSYRTDELDQICDSDSDGDDTGVDDYSNFNSNSNSNSLMTSSAQLGKLITKSEAKKRIREANGLNDNLLIQQLLKTYSWDALGQICDNDRDGADLNDDANPISMKCMFSNTNTPLHEISSIGSAPLALLKKVLDGWIDATMIQNVYGQTPLHIRCTNSQYSSSPVTMLIEANHKALKVKNNSGKTPLAVACLSGAVYTVIRNLVVAYPEALSIRDIHGHTPIDLLWSSFAKTLPGASAISAYLKNKANNHDQEAEMSGLLSRFHEKISFCLTHSYSLSHHRRIVPAEVEGVVEVEERDNDDLINSLLCHAIIHENLKHSPSTLLAILLTRDSELGYQVDEDGNTPLHLQISKRWNQSDCISVLLDKCGEQAACVSNNNGMLPLHLALDEMNSLSRNRGSKSTNKTGIACCDNKTIQKIVKAFPEGLEARNPTTLFLPFISAATAGNLELSYEFLIQSPNVVSNYTTD